MLTRQQNLRLFWGDEESPGILWDLRSIRMDGSFFGCIHHRLTSEDRKQVNKPAENLHGFGTSGSGLIPPEDWKRCEEILENLRAVTPIRTAPSWASVGIWDLGRGPGVLEVIYRYDRGDEHDSDYARRFLELVAIFERQVSKWYADIHWAGSLQAGRFVWGGQAGS